MKELLSTGPPVYWVITSGLNYTNEDVLRKMCGGQGCDSNSLSMQLFNAAKYPNV